MKYRFNPDNLREDIRRIGIVTIAAGAAHGVIEKGDLLSAIGMVIAGILAILIATLEETK